MLYHTFRFKNEFEFHRIVATLEEKEIPHRTHILRDTAIPALGFFDYYAEITITEEFRGEFIQLLNTESIEYMEKQKGKKTFKWSRIAFTLVGVYAIIATLLYFKYWDINKQSSSDKNFRYVWNYRNSQLKTIYQPTGSIIGISYDENYDYNFEYAQEYTKEGWLIIESFDSNEDGYYEKSIQYGKENRISLKL